MQRKHDSLPSEDSTHHSAGAGRGTQRVASAGEHGVLNTAARDLPAEPGGREPRFLVGVGASAGGLEALERLFAEMPNDTGMAFFVIQHLSPDFKSLMDELLARRTSMPIRPARDGMHVERDTIYLLPPKKEMLISGGRLLVTDKDLSESFSLPIDHFFRSLAEDAGPRAIAIVLSGTGSDGSRGVREVHAGGGMVIVQNPETAKFDGMPNSAIETGAVDHVMAPEQMAAELLHSIGHPRAEQMLRPSSVPAAGRQGIELIFELLRRAYGIDFAYYKPSTVARRIQRRLDMNRVGDLKEYAEKIRQDTKELESLYHDLLINVTQFFRDPEAFEALGEVLDEQIRGHANEDEFRVWVAGCATGEEAYSLAILIHELREKYGKSMPVKIFATDVHRPALDVASAGIYDGSSVENVSPQRLERYFIRHEDRYHVVNELRQWIVFAPHHVIKDAPFTKLDLIACRNLLIYLQPAAQKKVLFLFHFGLKTGGALLLGPSENPGEISDEFEKLDGHWKLYRKRRDVRLPPDLLLSNTERLTSPARGALLRTKANKAQFQEIFAQLLGETLPPSVLVNADGELLHTFGPARRFLHIPAGRPSLDVLEMASGDLHLAIAGAMQRAARDQEKISFHGIEVETDEVRTHVDLTVRPVKWASGDELYFLISFEPQDRVVSSPEDRTEMNVAEVSRERVNDLERELSHSRENLQATIEELETSNEELQATNEELLASNEELQSTNEELHSVNEELYTVNAEYQHKIDELTELTAEVDALLQSTEVQVIFLDQDLRIRKFTPSVEKTFNLVPQDVGRRLDSFQHNIEHPALLDGLEQVLSEQKKVEREVRAGDGRWFLLRILPFRKKEAISGVVLTLIDINTLRRTRNELWTVQQQFAAIMNRSASIVFVKSLDGKYVMANRAMSKVFGKPIDRIIGHTSEELVGSSAAEAMLRSDAQVLETGQEVQIEESLEIQGRAYHFVVSKFPLRDRQGNLVGLAGIKTDVTDLKRAETEAREAVAQRDRFLAMLSHELRNPLAAILSAASLVQRSVDDGDEILQPCEVIGRQAAQMSTLLDDLLDVARITHGTIRLRHEPCELASVCKEAIEAVGSMVADKRHELDMEPGDEPVWVTGDRARLLQVFENLLTNAAKYTPPGGKILVRIASESDEAVVQVIDNGIGIAAPLRSRIFEMFVQTDDSLDRRQGGMGLGLTLVKSLVLLHGGSVDVESDGMGQGSRFTVRLPLTAQRSESRAENDARPQDRAGNSDRLKIVLVEDNDDVREMLASLLVTEGHDVVTAPDGIAGRDKILEHQPDVALIDIGLPGMNGYKIARAIRKQSGNESTRLIALTGYGRREDQRAANKAGFHAHLVKPIRIEALRRALAAEQEKRSASSN